MKIHEFGKENKETVILLHGGGLSWWNYRKEAEILSDFHIVLPVLDGHAGSDRPFTSIEDNAAEVIEYIDSRFGGTVLAIGGLSLGAQILAEMLSQRGNICSHAVIESASVIPSGLTNALIGPSVKMSYGLIRKKWFARMQFKYLHIRDDLFDEYYADTSDISMNDMIAFLKANTAYSAKPSFAGCSADVRIIAGGKEQKSILRSAALLHDMLPASRLEIKEGLYHGEYSINHPEKYAQDLLDSLQPDEGERAADTSDPQAGPTDRMRTIPSRNGKSAYEIQAGINKKSFELNFNGGTIWCEHLDGMGDHEQAVIDKFRGDLRNIMRPTISSSMIIDLDETVITPAIEDAIVSALTGGSKTFRKIAFVGAGRSSAAFGDIERRGTVVKFLDDYEKAKEWVL